MKVLVCGGRDFEEPWAVFDALVELWNEDANGSMTVVHGANYRGADSYAAKWCALAKTLIPITELPFPADWDRYGKQAGPIRNRMMFEASRPDLVLAFPGGDGTKDMIEVARKGGAEVRTIGWSVENANPTITKGAILSDDGLYRYKLNREWAPSLQKMVWIMLNPSTADAEVDDPTIRRCMGFAKREGCGGIEVINLYALRATNPKELRTHSDPEGPDNLETWEQVLSGHSGPVVAGWGASSPGHLPGSRAAMWWLSQPMGAQCVGVTKQGHPRHPLYVKGDAPLIPFRGGHQDD